LEWIVLCPSPWALCFQGISLANKSDHHKAFRPKKGKKKEKTAELLPNCAEEGEYKKTGKLSWTQRAFWSLRPFLHMAVKPMPESCYLFQGEKPL